jgi:hypothetical protein
MMSISNCNKCTAPTQHPTHSSDVIVLWYGISPVVQAGYISGEEGDSPLDKLPLYELTYKVDQDTWWRVEEHRLYQGELEFREVGVYSTYEEADQLMMSLNIELHNLEGKDNDD